MSTTRPVKLHWVKVGKEVHSKEQRDGVPDFRIVYTTGEGGKQWHAKLRTSRPWVGPFESLRDAKDWAESV